MQKRTAGQKKRKRSRPALTALLFSVLSGGLFLLIIAAFIFSGAWRRPAEKEGGTDSTEISDPYISPVRVRKYQIEGVKPLCASPELPYGCEVTTLAAALNYAGYPCDKTDLAAHYLPKGSSENGTDPYYFYVGDPAVTEKSYGCFAPALEQCAVNYGAAVLDLSSSYVTETGGKTPDKRVNFDALLSWVARDIPVIAWTSIDRKTDDPLGDYTYMHDGKELTWQTGEHCVLMTGFDLDADTVTVADSNDGAEETCSLTTFREIWIERDCQAFIVLPKDRDVQEK